MQGAAVSRKAPPDRPVRAKNSPHEAASKTVTSTSLPFWPTPSRLASQVSSTVAKKEHAKATTQAVRPRSRRVAKKTLNQPPPSVAMAKPSRHPENTARAPPVSSG